MRDAKAAVHTAADRAERLRASADNLTQVLDQVDGMAREIDAAAAELQAEVGGLSNGGPPLDEPVKSSQGGSVGVGVASVDAAVKQVQQANK